MTGRSTQTTSQRVSPILTRSPLDHPELQDHHTSVPCLAYRDDSGANRLVALDRAQQTIGRGEDADVVIDWDRTVSRIHATVYLSDQGWAIADEGRSLNGTLVNGRKINAPTLLRDRDLVQVGETAIGFRSPG